jgi:hypothetical protein
MRLYPTGMQKWGIQGLLMWRGATRIPQKDIDQYGVIWHFMQPGWMPASSMMNVLNHNPDRFTVAGSRLRLLARSKENPAQRAGRFWGKWGRRIER